MVRTARLARGIPRGVCGELLFKTELKNSVFAKWEKYTIGKERRVIFQLPSQYCTQWRIEIILTDYRLTVECSYQVYYHHFKTRGQLDSHIYSYVQALGTGTIVKDHF